MNILRVTSAVYVLPPRFQHDSSTPQQTCGLTIKASRASIPQEKCFPHASSSTESPQDKFAHTPCNSEACTQAFRLSLSRIFSFVKHDTSERMTYSAIWEQRVSSWKAAAFAMNEQFLWKPRLRGRLFSYLFHSCGSFELLPLFKSGCCIFLPRAILAAGWMSRAYQAR